MRKVLLIWYDERHNELDRDGVEVVGRQKVATPLDAMYVRVFELPDESQDDLD